MSNLITEIITLSEVHLYPRFQWYQLCLYVCDRIWDFTFSPVPFNTTLVGVQKNRTRGKCPEHPCGRGPQTRIEGPHGLTEFAGTAGPRARMFPAQTSRNEVPRGMPPHTSPSHCGIDGNETVVQPAKETLDQDIEPLSSVHYTDMKSLVNSYIQKLFKPIGIYETAGQLLHPAYIQKLVQTKWEVSVHGRDLYLVKPTLGPPKKFQHLTKAEEVVITRLRIGHTKATKYHILSKEDRRLVVTTVVKHWPLTICCWSVHCYRNIVMNTTQSTCWMLSSRQFLRLA